MRIPAATWLILLTAPAFAADAAAQVRDPGMDWHGLRPPRGDMVEVREPVTSPSPPARAKPTAAAACRSGRKARAARKAGVTACARTVRPATPH